MSQAIQLARRQHSLLRILGGTVVVACLAAPARGDHPILLVIASQDRFHYEVTHMPDLDQARSTGPGVPGLPGDGKAYCTPTSVMNLVLFLANHGFPELAPSHGSWQPPEAYNPATLAVLQLANAMGTDADDGTSGAGWYTGLKNTLGGKFVVNQFYPNGDHGPTFQSLSLLALTGSLVTFAYGSYPILTVGRDGSITVGDRQGGHVVALSKAVRNGDQMLIGARDPADGAGNLLSQSLFGNTIWTVKDHTIHGPSFERTMSSLDYPQDDGLVRLIDSYVAVSPKAGFSLTDDRLAINYVTPAGFTGASRSPVQYFPSPDASPIADLILHRESHGLLVVTEGTRATSGGLYYVSLATGEGQEIDLDLSAEQPVNQISGGGGCIFFHISNCDLICEEIDGLEASPAQGQGKAPYPPQAMTFDPQTKELILLSISDRKLMRWAAGLQGAPRVLEIPSAVPLSGKGDLAVNPLDGTVWIFSEASTALYGLSEDRAGVLAAETFADPAIAKPVGLDFDDAGHLFVSSGGKIVEYEPTIVGGKKSWKLLAPDAAYFASFPAGPKLRITKCTTSFDPTVHDLKRPYNIPPEKTLPGRFEPDATRYNRRLKSVDLTRGSDGRLEYAALVHVDLLEAASAPRDLGTILRIADPTGRVIDDVLIDVEIPSGIGPELTCGGLGCPGPCGEAPARGGIVPLVCSDEDPSGQCICTLVCPVSGPCDCAIDGNFTFSLIPAPGSLPERYLADDVVTRRRPPPPGGGRQVPGDCNQDRRIDLSDGLCLFGYLFLGSPGVLPCGDGTATDPANLRLLDFNGDGALDITDGIAELGFLFLGSLPHVLGGDTITIEGCPGE